MKRKETSYNTQWANMHNKEFIWSPRARQKLVFSPPTLNETKTIFASSKAENWDYKTEAKTMKAILNLHKHTPRSSSPWTKRKPTRSPFSFFLLTLFTLLVFLFLFISYTKTPTSVFTTKNQASSQILQCTARLQALPPGEKFLWYAPHSGFSNQLSEFKNAVLMAGILNRTLVVPPVLDHHAVALGSCPKFRVTAPNQIRASVWNHSIELLRTGRYVSMADVIDLSSLVPSHVRVIDFRVFTSLWCDVPLDFTCVNDLNAQSSLFDSLRHCGSTLSGLSGSIDKCLYGVDEDCRTTVWTYKSGDQDGELDSFQPDEQLKKKKKLSFVRIRRDVYKALGAGSQAESATVLAFGTLFTSPYKGSELYIDILEARREQRIQSLIEESKFLPFVSEILSAGKKFVLETIKAPFLCAQLRLLDGQFKNHWKATFLGLKQKLESLKQSSPLPIHIFLMTDLPQSNWTGSYLGYLASDPDHFKLYFLREEDDLVIQTAKEVMAAQHGLQFGSLRSLNGISAQKTNCPGQRLPDILLYLEESVCSCGSLGFVGTAGSTIAESIELMRKNDVCSSSTLTAT